MPVLVPCTLGFFVTDGRIGYAQRICADLEAALPPPASRKRVPRPRHSIIVDSAKLRQLMSDRSLPTTAAALVEAAHLWNGAGGLRLAEAMLDHGECTDLQAQKVASGLGCSVDDFTAGVRVVVEAGKPRKRS